MVGCKTLKLLRLSLCAWFLMLGLMYLTGCMDLSGSGPAQLDRSLVNPAASPQIAYTRDGHVFCMRGWLGIFSEGMNALAERMDKQTKVSAVSVANEEWTTLRDFIIEAHAAGQLPGPLVLVGHSLGADSQVRVAEALNAKNIPVDLLITLDAVSPSKVTPNVKLVINVFKSKSIGDQLPMFRGVPLEAVDPTQTTVRNIDLRTDDPGFDASEVDHFNIEKSMGVHDLVVTAVEVACPPKSALRPPVLRPLVPTAVKPPARSPSTPVAKPAPDGPTPNTF